jgi:hypothetical protein
LTQNYLLMSIFFTCCSCQYFLRIVGVSFDCFAPRRATTTLLRGIRGPEYQRKSCQCDTAVGRYCPLRPGVARQLDERSGLPWFRLSYRARGAHHSTQRRLVKSSRLLTSKQPAIMTFRCPGSCANQADLPRPALRGTDVAFILARGLRHTRADGRMRQAVLKARPNLSRWQGCL